MVCVDDFIYSLNINFDIAGSSISYTRLKLLFSKIRINLVMQVKNIHYIYFPMKTVRYNAHNI